MFRVAARLRRFDYVSEICIAIAIVCTIVGISHAQSPIGMSQDAFNGFMQATINSYGQRLDHLESALNWSAGALIANLIAHLFQISTQLRKRRETSSRIIGGDS